MVLLALVVVRFLQALISPHQPQALEVIVRLSRLQWPKEGTRPCDKPKSNAPDPVREQVVVEENKSKSRPSTLTSSSGTTKTSSLTKRLLHNMLAHFNSNYIEYIARKGMLTGIDVTHQRESKHRCCSACREEKLPGTTLLQYEMKNQSPNTTGQIFIKLLLQMLYFIFCFLCIALVCIFNKFRCTFTELKRSVKDPKLS